MSDAKLTRRGFLGRGALGAVALGTASSEVQLHGGPSVGKPWGYDVAALRQVDPALIHYRRKCGFPLRHSSARRLAVTPDGDVIVAADRCLLRYSVEGDLRHEMPLEEPPRCVAADFAGHIWVGFRDRVVIQSVEGIRIRQWPAFEGRPFLTAICVDGGRVFVADSGNRVVHRCDHNGMADLRIGGRDPRRNVPGLVVPSPYLDVERGCDGLLRVTNPGRHRVEVYTPDGDLETSWGRPGAAIDSFCGCCNPVGIARLPDDRWVTAEKGLARVKVFSPQGVLESVVAGPDDFAGTAQDSAETDSATGGGVALDVATTPNGEVLVLDPVGSTIQVFVRKTPHAA